MSAIVGNDSNIKTANFDKNLMQAINKLDKVVKYIDEAYLQKVINTSMITVPKKLGVRKYVRQAAAEPVQIQEQVVSVDEQIDAGQDFVPVEETNDMERVELINADSL